MKTKIVSSVLIVLILFILISGCGGKKSLNSSSDITIGAIIPLTGSEAAVGQESKRGLEMAADRLNAAGGVNGKTIKLIIEDDKSEPSTGISAINKLLTVDKIQYLVGGYSSPVMGPVLERVKSSNANIVAVINGTTSSKIDQSLGKEDWFFKLYPYDYNYQRSNADFIKTIQPAPKTIAIVYEDGLFGSTQSAFAKQYLEQEGFKIVSYEPFKTGTPDLSPLLTRVKATNPDILFWVGYFGDSVLLVKQSKELNFNPKLFVGSTVWVSQPEFFAGLGKDSTYVVGIDLWMPTVQYQASQTDPQGLPSTKDWLESYTKKFNAEPNHWSIINYIAVEAIAEAVKKAGSNDPIAVKKALKETNTMTPMGPLSFTKSQFGGLQGFTDMVAFQWQDGKRVLVYPPSVANGKLKYPTPQWNQRQR